MADSAAALHSGCAVAAPTALPRSPAACGALHGPRIAAAVCTVAAGDRRCASQSGMLSCALTERSMVRIAEPKLPFSFPGTLTNRASKRRSGCFSARAGSTLWLRERRLRRTALCRCASAALATDPLPRRLDGLRGGPSSAQASTCPSAKRPPRGGSRRVLDALCSELGSVAGRPGGCDCNGFGRAHTLWEGAPCAGSMRPSATPSHLAAFSAARSVASGLHGSDAACSSPGAAATGAVRERLALRGSRAALPDTEMKAARGSGDRVRC